MKLVFNILFLTLTIIAIGVESFESSDLISAVEFGKVIDTNSAIVITDSAEGSYFGFSALLIPSRNSSTTPAWILVGAPRGNYPKNNFFNEPGLLWKCSLGKQNGKDTCEILDLDPVDGLERGRICYQRQCRNEKRDNSWLGMSLFRNGEFVIVCSPRWQRGFSKIDDYKLNGLCYWIPVDLLSFEPFPSAIGSKFANERYSINDFGTQRLFPLMNPSMQVVERIPVWAWGQAGFSGFIGENNELFLGAPGLNGWNGTIIRYTSNSAKNESSTSRPRLNRKNQKIFTEFTILNTEWLQNIYELEYLGYAVTTGKYFRHEEDGAEIEQRPMVAASSPRGSSMYGFVLIFQYPETEDAFWLPYQTIFGDQFSSYFGSSLLSMDLNGDGLDELIVTAPLFSVKTNSEESSSEGSSRTGEEGCIFVYSSKWTLTKFSQSEVICGKKLKGRFGYSVASIGDINEDGFFDIAIGAPYEDGLSGAIYIYTGHTNFGNTYGNHATKLYLKISPTTLNLPFKAFGSCIYGGVDLDNNDLPDLVIGAYLSDTVVILRTRHQISLESKTDILVNDTFVDVLKHDNLENFVIRHCVRIADKSKHQSEELLQLELDIKLHVDPGYNRFKILGPLTTDGFEFNRTNFNKIYYSVQINSSQTHCMEWKVELTLEFDAEYTHPKPFTVLTEVTYSQNIHTDQSHTIYNIVDNSINASGEAFERFCPHCPVNVTKSQEVFFPIVADNCHSDGNPKCSPDLWLKFDIFVQYRNGEIQEMKNNGQITLGNFSFLFINLTLENSKYAETAYFPVVDLSLNMPQDIISGLHQGNLEECEFLNITTTAKTIQGISPKVLRCQFGHLLQPNEQNSIKLSFNFHKVFAQTQKTIFNIESQSYPKKDETIEKSVQSVSIELNSEFSVGMLGSSENFTISKESFYTPFSQVYKLDLKGSTPIAKMTLSLWIPVFYRVKERTEEVILTNEPMGENTKCQIITKNKNFAKISTFNAVIQKLQPDPKTWKNITHTKLKDFLTLKLKCKDENDINCIQIVCEILEVVPNNGIIEVTFPMLINNNVTNELMEMLNKPMLQVISLATLKLFNDSISYFNASESIIYNYEVQAHEPIPFWIYMFSIIIGIIVILLILLVLMRCGFFKRPKASDWEPIDQNKEIQALNSECQDWGRWEYSKAYAREA